MNNKYSIVYKLFQKTNVEVFIIIKLILFFFSSFAFAMSSFVGNVFFTTVSVGFNLSFTLPDFIAPIVFAWFKKLFSLVEVFCNLPLSKDVTALTSAFFCSAIKFSLIYQTQMNWI